MGAFTFLLGGAAAALSFALLRAGGGWTTAGRAAVLFLAGYGVFRGDTIGPWYFPVLVGAMVAFVLDAGYDLWRDARRRTSSA
ncbi:hypothetical protein LEP48_12020 [Isoptericola sp. NEAU-Y5]|uniref:Uncharacterized protein n=1 Tax=Isoptericola luteus TaxID=2879484 RepID=A0ABS7ZKA7_9MICO|nr:hypothetical protein [Isoptericola sp. NEAU-Y5]MCA5894069.1 hypothetical protein [Isoptericola sp. NEAU-Y5]